MLFDANISCTLFIHMSISKTCKPLLILLCFPAHSHSRKERERRPQVVRRSTPDSGVLVRLKAQMAEVRSKMSAKNQVLEARAPAEPRPGPSGAFSVEEVPSHRADSELSACRKTSDLDLLCRATVRSRASRPGKDCQILKGCWTYAAHGFCF